MDRLDDRIGRGRQEAVDEVGAGDRLGLGAAVAAEFGPDPRETEQRPAFLEREPDDVFLSFLSLDSAQAHTLQNCSRATGSGSPASASRANAATTCCGCW